MTPRHRFLPLLIVLSLLISLFDALGVSAAAPTALDIAFIADVTDDVASEFEKNIFAGHQDVDGVYYGVSYPQGLQLGC